MNSAVSWPARLLWSEVVPPKAAEDCRSPRRSANSKRVRAGDSFWSAPVRWRFSPRPPINPMPENPASTPFEVDEPILNSPYELPGHRWYLRQGEAPVKREGRRPSIVFRPADQAEPWVTSDGILVPAYDCTNADELALVNRVRERVQAWRDAGWPGATRTTLELLEHWSRPDRDLEHRLIFAQREAVEDVIFHVEARENFRQGIELNCRDVRASRRRLLALPRTRGWTSSAGATPPRQQTGQTPPRPTGQRWNVLETAAAEPPRSPDGSPVAGRCGKPERRRLASFSAPASLPKTRLNAILPHAV